MLKELQDIGLSEKEARVYLAALELGKTTAEKLATHAKVNRSTTYVQLESLMKMGLMSTYEEGKKTFFAPESPSYLKRILDMKRQEIGAREKELGSLMPELNHLFEGAGERPVVRFYNGKEGISAMREDALEMPKGEDMLIIYSYDALFGLFSEKEADEYSRKRKEKNIKIRSIYTRKEGKLSNEGLSNLAKRRFISDKKMPLNTDFFVYGNKVAVMALKGTIFGVVIESKEIAQSFRTLFELIWSLGEE